MESCVYTTSLAEGTLAQFNQVALGVGEFVVRGEFNGSWSRCRLDLETSGWTLLHYPKEEFRRLCFRSCV